MVCSTCGKSMINTEQGTRTSDGGSSCSLWQGTSSNVTSWCLLNRFRTHFEPFQNAFEPFQNAFWTVSKHFHTSTTRVYQVSGICTKHLLYRYVCVRSWAGKYRPCSSSGGFSTFWKYNDSEFAAVCSWAHNAFANVLIFQIRVGFVKIIKNKNKITSLCSTRDEHVDISSEASF